MSLNKKNSLMLTRQRRALVYIFNSLRAAWQRRKKAWFAQPHTGQQPMIPQLFVTAQRRWRKMLKRTSWQIRKLAKFAQWHTGAQPKIQPFLLRQRRKFKARRLRGQLFKLFNTGLQPSQAIVRFRSRWRKSWSKANFAIRKLARFAQWHTGASAAPDTSIRQPMLTRWRRKIRTSFQQRKLARFAQWHTGATQRLQWALTRQRRKFKTRRPRAHFFPLFNTGQQLSTLWLYMHTRKRARYWPRRGRRTSFMTFHTGLSPSVPTGVGWIMAPLASSRRRGGS